MSDDVVDAEIVDDQSSTRVETTTTVLGQHTQTSYEELAEERNLRRIEARQAIAKAARDDAERKRKEGVERRSSGASATSSVVHYKVGNREYPYRTVATCKTCNHPQRAEIERLLAAGRTPRSIIKDMPEDFDLTIANIMDHRSKHLPSDLATMVALIDNRAEERGLAIEDGVNMLIDEVSLARMVVQKTAERLSNGEIEPSLNDGLTAAKFLSTVGDSGSADLDQHVFVATMTRYFEIAQATMTSEQFQQFLVSLQSDPVLAALTSEPKALEDGR